MLLSDRRSEHPTATRSQIRRTGCTLSTECFFAHDEGNFPSLRKQKEDRTKDQTRPGDPNLERHRPFLRPLLAREFSGPFDFGTVSWTMVRQSERYSYSSLPEGNWTLTNGTNAAPTIPVLSSRSLSRRLLVLACTTPPGEVLCQIKKWREGDRSLFTHFPKYLNSEVCRMTQTTRARCKNRPLKRADGIYLSPHSDSLFQQITKSLISTMSQELITRTLSSYKTDTRTVARQDLHGQIEGVHQSVSVLQWTQDTNTPHRSETNGSEKVLFDE